MEIPNEDNKFIIKGDTIPYVELKQSPIMTINGKDGEILRFEQNGDVFYKGELVENAKDVVEGFREFLTQQGVIK